MSAEATGGEGAEKERQLRAQLLQFQVEARRKREEGGERSDARQGQEEEGQAAQDSAAANTFLDKRCVHFRSLSCALPFGLEGLFVISRGCVKGTRATRQPATAAAPPTPSRWMRPRALTCSRTRGLNVSSGPPLASLSFVCLFPARFVPVIVW